MTREDFNIGWKVVYGIVAVVDVIIYFQAKEFWLFQLFGFLTFLLFIFLLIDLLILKNWKDIYFFLLILAIVICWIFSFGIKLSDEASKGYAQNYILSSVSQGLAALFALVFTISLIAAQMSVKYSARMIKIFFKWYIILYMILFIISIILPLIGMKLARDNIKLILNISISLTGTCIILLIPYFLDFKEKLTPERFLNELFENTAKIPNNNEKKLENIKIIQDVIIAAFLERDYDTFSLGIERLGTTLMHTKNEEIFYDLIGRFEIIMENVIDNKYALKIVVIELNKTNRKILTEKEITKFKAILDKIRNSGSYAIERGFGFTLELVFFNLCDLVKISVEYYRIFNDDEPLTYSIRILDEVISYSYGKIQNYLFCSLLTQLFLLDKFLKENDINRDNIPSIMRHYKGTELLNTAFNWAISIVNKERSNEEVIRSILRQI